MGTTEKAQGRQSLGFGCFQHSVSDRETSCRDYNGGVPVEGAGARAGVGVVGMTGTIGPGAVSTGVPSIDPHGSHGLIV